MRGIHGFSGDIIPGAFGNFTYGPIRNCRLPALAVPRTRERNSKKILLASYHRRNHHRRHRNSVDVYDVNVPPVLLMNTRLHI